MTTETGRYQVFLEVPARSIRRMVWSFDDPQIARGHMRHGADSAGKGFWYSVTDDETGEEIARRQNKFERVWAAPMAQKEARK